ncbi:MAG: YaiI/YqxD family protein [Gammaproteobacteria bacterium]|nr:YaiI/YqxD family protein [Gammaproteobacteria bacterium]
MKIWVDADACPSAIKDIIMKAANTRFIHTVFIANKPIYFPASPYLSAIQVNQGADIADQYIVDHAMEGDLAITQDIPLAALLVAKKVVVISLHGTLFTANNIGERLSIRNFMQDIRDQGGQTGGPKPFSQKDKQKFAQTFDQQLRKSCQSLH